MAEGRQLEGQGIGGTGRQSFRRRRRHWNRLSDSEGVADAPCEPSSKRESRAEGGTRDDGEISAGTWPGEEALRRQATAAAITAYEDALRSGDPKGQACRAALRAYLEHGPDDADASDAVVKAIASTNFG